MGKARLAAECTALAQRNAMEDQNLAHQQKLESDRLQHQLHTLQQEQAKIAAEQQRIADEKQKLASDHAHLDSYRSSLEQDRSALATDRSNLEHSAHRLLSQPTVVPQPVIVQQPTSYLPPSGYYTPNYSAGAIYANGPGFNIRNHLGLDTAPAPPPALYPTASAQRLSSLWPDDMTRTEANFRHNIDRFRYGY